MHSLYAFGMLTLLVVMLLVIGATINHALSVMFGKSAAYVIMLAGFGAMLLYLGLTGAGPTLDSVGSGMLGAAFVFSMMLIGRRCNG
jgi:small-conductance mechanosensitive channel